MVRFEILRNHHRHFTTPIIQKFPKARASRELCDHHRKIRVLPKWQNLTVHLNNPWGLLALLSIPAILAVHLFRQRFPERMTAGTHLWASLTEIRQAGRRLDRLPLSRSLLFELLAAVAVTIVLCRPQFQPAEQAMHLVVVLDDSASMLSEPPGRPSFVNAAIETIEERSTSPDAKVVLTVLLTGPRPVMLAGPSVSFPEASESLQQWRPTATKHDPAAALDLAHQLADETGQVLFVTDSQPETTDAIDYVSVGRSIDNVGFTASRFNLATQTGPATVFLRVRNFCKLSANVDIRINSVNAVPATGDENENDPSAEIDRRSIPIAPDSAASVEVPLPAGCTHVVARLTARQDALSLDNTVELLRPPERTIRYGFDLPTDDFRRLAVVRVLESIDFATLSETADAHIVFGTLKTKTIGPDQWVVSLAEPREPGSDGTVDISGPYVTDRRSPIMTGVTFDGVISAGIGPVEGLFPLISSGDRVLFGQRTQSNGQPAWYLNLDLNRSTLIDSPDWPILLSNIVTQRRSILPGLERRNFRLGENVQFRNRQPAPDSPAEWTLARQVDGTTDNSPTTPITAGRQIDIGPHLLKSPGVYEIHSGETLIDRFAVNFHNAAESNLQSLTPGESILSAPSELATLDSPFTWVTILALGCGLLAIVANWRTLAEPRQN
jgi:hypothetical protein